MPTTMQTRSASASSAATSATSTIYRLWCFCPDIADCSLFDVKIEYSETVSQLREIIHSKIRNRLAGIDAGQLILWKVEIEFPKHEMASRHFKTITLSDFVKNGKELEPWSTLTEEFAQDPKPNHLHIVVVQHPATATGAFFVLRRVDMLTKKLHALYSAGLRRKPGSSNKDSSNNDSAKRRKLEHDRSDAIKQGLMAETPSDAANPYNYLTQQDKYPVMNGRPYSHRGQSIFLYNSIFQRYEDLLDDDTWAPSAEKYKLAEELMETAADIYPNESTRAEALKQLLDVILDSLITRRRNSDGTSSDVITTTKTYLPRPVDCLVLNLEMKNEIGAGSSDPSIKAVLSYRKWVVENYSDEVLSRCHCPAFLVAMAGPWLCILGAVFSNQVVSQPLSDFMWIGGDAHNTHVRLHKLTRHFYALSTCLRELDEFYSNLPIIKPPGAELSLPAPTIPNMQLKYIATLLQDSDRAIYEGEIRNGQGVTKVVVKFTERYNEKAHQILAEKDLAPKLFHTRPIGGGLTMLVMELVSGYHDLPNNPEFVGRVQEAIGVLHNAEFVFGDLRRPNVLVRKDGGAMLVDFDWCGKHGVAKYPMRINDTIKWATGVERGGLMRKEHDLEMLKSLFEGV